MQMSQEQQYEEEEEEENLFILSVTLSNNQTYLVEVKKNVEAKELAQRFCNENGMQNDVVIKRELTALLKQYIESYHQQQQEQESDLQ